MTGLLGLLSMIFIIALFGLSMLAFEYIPSSRLPGNLLLSLRVEYTLIIIGAKVVLWLVALIAFWTGLPLGQGLVSLTGSVLALFALTASTVVLSVMLLAALRSSNYLWNGLAWISTLNIVEFSAFAVSRYF